MGSRAYRLAGQRTVEGYLQPPVLGVIEALDRLQQQHGVDGAVAEIGVHHGRLLIGLMLLRPSGVLAVDVFGAQELNVDQSGAGDKAAFLKNVDRWSSRNRLEIIEQDSTLVSPGQVKDRVGGVRWFSVDGGHTPDIVRSDMRLAQQSLVDGGVVVADDVFNEEWPGVSEGTYQYLRDGELVPFLIAQNKTYFTQPEWADRYRGAVVEVFSNRFWVEPVAKTFADHEVVVLVRLPARPLPILWRTYHKIKG